MGQIQDIINKAKDDLLNTLEQLVLSKDLDIATATDKIQLLEIKVEKEKSLSTEIEAQLDVLWAANQTLQKELKSSKMPDIGVNTHFFSAAVYKEIDRAIACLKDLGVKYVRQDFDYNPDTGKLLQHDLWVNNIKPKLDDLEIEVRPMFYMRGNGYTSHKLLAENYPYFKQHEIGNEVALNSLIRPNSGLRPEHYDSVKLTKDGQYILQAFNAIIEKPLVPIISITWVHYYFIQYIRSLGVNAKLCVHSYSDGFYNVGNQPGFTGLNAWTAARKMFGEMVTSIGETNFYPTTGTPYSDANQVRKLIPMFTDMLGTEAEVIYLFSLLDEPHRKGVEATMGLYTADYKAKPSVAELKKLIY